MESKASKGLKVVYEVEVSHNKHVYFRDMFDDKEQARGKMREYALEVKAVNKLDTIEAKKDRAGNVWGYELNFKSTNCHFLEVGMYQRVVKA